MSMIVWLLLELALGLIASKVVSTTGEGTVVDILLGMLVRLSPAGFPTFSAAPG